MPGWNLKTGEFTEARVSEDEYWSLFNYVFSDACRQTNTYKFGLVKAICDQIYNLHESQDGYYLSYKCIFEKFAENYWNLVSRYHLKQMLYNGTSEYSKVELIINNITGSLTDENYISFKALSESDAKRVVASVTAECKRYVIGALYSDFEGKLYSFNISDDGVYLHRDAYAFISKFKPEIEKMNYYSWAKYLEKINDDDKIIRLLDKLDLSTPRRNDLSIYRIILNEEFKENVCFYCGTKIDNRTQVDHFIPWSFMKDDKIWNFVLACPTCNVRKSNRIPSELFLNRIIERNRDVRDISNPIVESDFASYDESVLMRAWEYAQQGGFKLYNG